MRIRVFTILSRLALALACSSAMAEKIYKTVDEHGKISFTNKPPLASSAEGGTREVTIKEASSNQSQITKVGSLFYCGNIELPESEGSEVNFYNELLQRKRTWVRELASHDRALLESARYRRRSSDYGINATPEKLSSARDWRCAVSWAVSQEEILAERKVSLEKDVAYDIRRRDALQGIQDRTCGSKPQFSLHGTVMPTDTLTNQGQWESCVGPHRSLIRQVQQQIDDKNKSLGILHGIEVRFESVK
jgi:hypothetical protein